MIDFWHRPERFRFRHSRQADPSRWGQPPRVVLRDDSGWKTTPRTVSQSR